MTTATASPTAKVEKPLIPGPGILAPKQLWTTYTWERGQGRSQAEAAEEALDRNHVSPKSDRERITQQLHRQELEWGLEQTPQEQVEEAEREAAEAEAIEAAHAAANPEPGSAEATFKDAQRRVVELERHQSRIAPEVFAGDADATAEMLDIESQLAAAQKVVKVGNLKDEELPRREQEAIENAAKAAKAAALAESRELQPERIRAVAAVDKCAAAYVQALVACRSVCDRQAAALSHAGYTGIDVSRRRYHTDRATWGLCHSLLAAGGSDLLDLAEEPAQRHEALAATEPSPV
jgi:hypothetical protein